MINIVIYEPEIPPNTGNIIRLCANTGVLLHLIRPLGFSLDNSRLKRAGLDYHELAHISVHDSFTKFITETNIKRIFACSTKGKMCYADAKFKIGDALLFGHETRGLPLSILNQFTPDNVLRIPMRPNSRSLNLSNSVAIVLYEALRQIGFDNMVT